jgi:hypothetical protein
LLIRPRRSHGVSLGQTLPQKFPSIADRHRRKPRPEVDGLSRMHRPVDNENRRLALGPGGSPLDALDGPRGEIVPAVFGSIGDERLDRVAPPRGDECRQTVRDPAGLAHDQR